MNPTINGLSTTTLAISDCNGAKQWPLHRFRIDDSCSSHTERKDPRA